MLLSMIRLLVVAGLLMVTPLSAPPDILPTSLGPLKLQSWLEGEGARASINRLHGKPIPMVSGLVAQYGANSDGLESKATLWLSEAKNDSEAEKLLEKMVEGLKKGGPSFGHYRSWKQGDQIIHRVYGNGQKHVLFQRGPWIIWLAYDPGLPDEVVNKILSIGRKPVPIPKS
jgi:hypothetical protein